jgi:multidrug resistance efflux pump
VTKPSANEPSQATDVAPAGAPKKPARPRRFVPFVLIATVLVVYLGYRFYKSTLPFEWSGTVEARTITVGSRAGGRVKEVLLREGARVTAGQPLLTLEVGDLEAQRLTAQAELDQASANLDKTQRGARPEEIAEAKARAATATAALQEQRAGARHEQIDAAKARRVAAQVAVDKAEIDVGRVRKLAATGAVSQADADVAETAVRSAHAQLDAANSELEELQNGTRREDIAQAAARAAEANASAKLVEIGARAEDIRAAQARVDSARGRLEQIKVLIDELTVKAPRDARVEVLDLRPGDILAANAAAATLLEDDQLYVRIYIPETQIGRVQLGATVPVTVDSFPDRSFAGVVEHINDVGEYSPRNLQTADERADQVFAARIGLKEGRDVLRAGMAAFIRVKK